MAEAALSLTKAETAFFESGGETVDKSLTEGLPAPEPKVEPKPAIDAPAEPADPAEPAEPSTVAKPEDVAKQNKEAAEARRKLLADLGAVPLEALQEARSEAKTLKQQQAELAAWKQQVEPLLAQLKPKQEQGNPYDPNTQPNEFANYEWTALQNQVKTLTQSQQQAEQARQAQEQTNRVLNWGQAQERAFAEKQTDYADAAKFAREARAKQLAVFNPDPAWINATLDGEIAQIIHMAAQSTMQGIPMNPAEKAYQYALANGYTPKGKETPDSSIAAAAKINAGQQAAGGLKGGASPKGTVTLDDVAAIDTSTPAGRKKFDEMWAKAL